MRVAVSLNLHMCKPPRPVKPGDTCWTLREVSPSGSVTKKVLGYKTTILLAKVVFVVQESAFARVQRMGAKEVFAFAVGDVVPATNMPSGGWEGVTMSPLPPPKGRSENSFRTVSDRSLEVWEADFFFGGEDARAMICGFMATPARKQNPAGGYRMESEPEGRASSVDALEHILRTVSDEPFVES